MISRLARLGVLLLPIMALVASMAPPAGALNAGAVVLTGTANVAAGLSYPCAGPNGPVPGVPLDPSKCPPPVGAGNGPIGVTFNGQGVGVVVKVDKPKCGGAPSTCVEAGTFNITATGNVNGWCGLSSGNLTGTVTPAIALGTKANTRIFTVTFTGVGGLLVITGTTNQEKEIVVGAVAAVPDAAGGSSCTNKAAKNFIIAGAIALVSPQPPPA